VSAPGVPERLLGYTSHRRFNSFVRKTMQVRHHEFSAFRNTTCLVQKPPTASPIIVVWLGLSTCQIIDHYL
jgi:hypothetical protein